MEQQELCKIPIGQMEPYIDQSDLLECHMDMDEVMAAYDDWLKEVNSQPATQEDIESLD